MVFSLNIRPAVKAKATSIKIKTNNSHPKTKIAKSGLEQPQDPTEHNICGKSDSDLLH